MAVRSKSEDRFLMSDNRFGVTRWSLERQRSVAAQRRKWRQWSDVRSRRRAESRTRLANRTQSGRQSTCD